MAEDTQKSKTDAPTRSWAGTSVIISLVALALSGFTIYWQFYPRDTTKATLTWSGLNPIESALTREWRITVVVSFVNTGNRPTILEGLAISARSVNANFEDQSCDKKPGDDWITMPWQTTNSHGEEPSSAIPRVVSTGNAISSVYSFRSFPYIVDDGYFISKFFCIKYSMIDSDGDRVEKSHPIGIYNFGDNGVESFKSNPRINALIEVVP